MLYELEVHGRTRQVAVRRVPAGFAVTLDGREWMVDAVRVPPHTWSLIVDGISREVIVAPRDVGQLSAQVGAATALVSLGRLGRPSRPDAAGIAGATVQRLVAPMPGKVTRVLVKVGDEVRAHQAVVVVEAMKMENELRAGIDGVVSDVQVRDGQPVESGALLVLITKR